MSPRLSNEQMLAVEYGLDNRRAWVPVDLPQNVNVADLPYWVKGLQIDWMVNYANRPSITVKVIEGFTIRHWEDQEYDFKDGLYYSTHPDGRGDFMGANKMRWYLDKVHKGYPKYPDGHLDWSHPIEVEQYRFRSSQTGGLGGAHVPMRLTDGSVGFLWGAWIGAQLPNYIHVASSHGGGWIHEDLFIKLVSIYQPHLGLARVQVGSIQNIEPTLYPGCPPKDFPDAPAFYTDHPLSERLEKYVRQRLIDKGVDPSTLPEAIESRY